LVGISLTITYNRLKIKDSKTNMSQRFIKRGFKILLLGVVITIISLVIIPERFVMFGALHCIGTSIIIAIPFLNFRSLNVIFGSGLILIGIFLEYLTFDFSWLLPLGLMPPHYYSIDYFPLLPWFGVVLIGITIGHYLYPEGKREIHFSINSEFTVFKSICFIGRHSLYFYLLHQPILFAFIFIMIFFF
jgi:uncharacterized membrane protein